jgi:hypothetical protein
VAVLERTDHRLCMPELMPAKLAATAPNGKQAYITRAIAARGGLWGRGL